MSKRNRESDGRYAREQRCDSCGRGIFGATTEYATDEEVCGNGDGPGFFLCYRRPRCAARYAGLDVEQRRTLFTAQRIANQAFEAARQASRPLTQDERNLVTLADALDAQAASCDDRMKREYGSAQLREVAGLGHLTFDLGIIEGQRATYRLVAATIRSLAGLPLPS